MTIYIISPIKTITEKQANRLEKYVKKLESEGHSIYWPFVDTDQTLDIFSISVTNLIAMMKANQIHIAWSEESKFEYGMAFARNKMVIPIPGFFPRSPEVNSLSDMVNIVNNVAKEQKEKKNA